MTIAITIICYTLLCDRSYINMAVNPKDDYESLSRLIYPSIEASGNVYYGQTRKLTMDEVFDKNELGFESHIESVRVINEYADYGFTYDSYFCWKLGPLKGSIRIKPFENEFFTFENFPDQYNTTTSKWEPIRIIDEGKIINYVSVDEGDPAGVKFGGALFAKYNIIKSSKRVDNILHSGSYTTYENDISLEFDYLCLTDRCSPINGNDGVNNFYVNESSLYIHIGTLGGFVYTTPLTITASGSGTLTIELRLSGNTLGQTDGKSYDIKRPGGDWVTYDLWMLHDERDTDRHVENYVGRKCDCYRTLLTSTPLRLNDGESIQIKSENPVLGDEDNYIYFNITGTGDVKAILSGNISSMYGRYLQQVQQCRFNRMFCANPLITSASKLILSDLSSLGYFDLFDLFWHCTGLVDAPNMSGCAVGSASCMSMFEGCTSLVKPPRLPLESSLSDDTHSCFIEMFNGCTSLEESPIIHSYNNFDLSTNATRMFSICSSLRTVRCYTDPSYAINFIGTSVTDGIFYCRTGTGDQWRNYGVVPATWSIIEEDYNRNDYYLSGYNLHFAEIDKYNYSPDQLVVSGSDSWTNGRGRITDKSTVFNMLKSNPFLDGSVHPNTYNVDGSYNQDIWGYKCFNSPVSFRNGIYFDWSSITSLYDIHDFKFNVETYLVIGENNYRRTDRDIEIDSDELHHSKFSSKSSESVANVEVIAGSASYESPTEGKLLLNRSQINLTSYLGYRENVSPSLTLDSLYIDDCASIRTSAYTEVSRIESGFFDELDGWTANTVSYNTGKILVSSISADDAYISVIKNKTTGSSKVSIKSDSIYIDGYISSMCPYYIARMYGQYDNGFPVGAITVIKIELDSYDTAGKINWSAIGHVFYWNESNHIVMFDHTPAKGSYHDNSESTQIPGLSSAGSNLINEVDLGTGSITCSTIYNDNVTSGNNVRLPILQGQFFVPLSAHTQLDQPWVCLAMRIK